MKPFFTRKQITELLGLSSRQLNYWTLIGAIKPQKIARGSRTFYRYSEKDIERLRELAQLVTEGLPVSKAVSKIRSKTPTLIPFSQFSDRLHEEESRALRCQNALICISIKTRNIRDSSQVTQAVSSMKRSYDLFTQMNEDSFLWVLLQTDESYARTVLERFLENGLKNKVLAGFSSVIPRQKGDGDHLIRRAIQNLGIFQEEVLKCVPKT